jgi:type I restriction enzyme M protein
MNTIIHDMDVDLQRGDTVINPKFRDATGSLMRFDVVVANPMWNQPFDPELFTDDPFDRFLKAGGATSGKGDWAWLQHTIAAMNDGGRAAVVLDTGATTRGSGSKNEDKERNIRKWFVDRDLIEGVIVLPENIFYNTPAQGVIVVLNKRKPASRKNKILLLNASRHFTKGKPKNHLTQADVITLAQHYHAWADFDGVVRVIDTDEAITADYNLSPSRWVTRANVQTSTPIATLIEQARALADEGLAIDERLFALLAPLGARDRELEEVVG